MSFQDKVCCVCKQKLDLILFSKGAKRCKPCDSIYKKEWALKNKEVIKEKAHIRYEQNKEIIKERTHRYNRENREKINDKKRNNPMVKLWKHNDHLRNKERYNAISREHYQKNKEKIKEYVKDWVCKNPEKKKMTQNNYRALKRTSGTKLKGTDINGLLIQQRGHCFYCDKLLDKYEVEHIIPLSRNGEHKLYNLVLSCPSCNRTKNGRDPEIFVNEILGKIAI